MEAMELLLTRYSASKLGAPPPSMEAVDAILEAAAHAPDHGRLKPWRLILIEGDARQAFGEILAKSLAGRNPLAGDQALAREREKALRAPLIIVVATRCDRSAKIPTVEQILSAGCAAYSVMLAAFAQGLGAFWRTGEAAYDEVVKGALGIASDDQIIGFLYVGTDIGGAPSRPRAVVQELAQRWNGDDSKVEISSGAPPRVVSDPRTGRGSSRATVLWNITEPLLALRLSESMIGVQPGHGTEL